MLSGMSIAKVVYDNRIGLAKSEGPHWKGMNALKNAAKVLGKDLQADLGNKQPSADEPAHQRRDQAIDKPPKAEATQPSADSLEGMIRKIAEQAQPKQAPIDESMVRKIAEKAASAKAEEVASRPIEITIPDRPDPIKIEDVHSCFPEALRIASIHGRLLLHGPKGTGKSTIAKGISKAMDYGTDYRLVSGTAETSIYDLIGMQDAEGTFHIRPMLEAFEGGMLLFFDEFDALDASTGVACNAILDDGGDASVPMRTGNCMAIRHDKFLPILAVNTLHGGTSAYTGRMKQDAATLSRFPELVRLFVDYDRKIEGRILGADLDLAKMMWSLRDNAVKMNLDESRVITTRDFVAAAREVKARKDGHDGALSNVAIMDRLVEGWTPEERSKCRC
jgi:hypothetical protein